MFAELGIYIVILICFGLFCMQQAGSKGKSRVTGFVMGVFLGPIAIGYYLTVKTPKKGEGMEAAPIPKEKELQSLEELRKNGTLTEQEYRNLLKEKFGL